MTLNTTKSSWEKFTENPWQQYQVLIGLPSKVYVLKNTACKESFPGSRCIENVVSNYR